MFSVAPANCHLHHLHQTTFETPKYLQKRCFETAYLGKNEIFLK
jgi:hypothetical protein